LRRLFDACFDWARFGGARETSRELELVVLGHGLAILRRRARRPALWPVDRAFLAAASRLVPRNRPSSFFVTPDALMRWHRQLVAHRWTYPTRKPGRPPIAAEIRELVVRPSAGEPPLG
jgi:putative transposase